MKAKAFRLTLLLCLPGWYPAYAAGDTLSVFFPFNKRSLTTVAECALDAAIYSGVISYRQPVQIIGYTDEVGGNGYNLGLSEQRAQSVRTYLVQSGFLDERITLITGKGEQGARQAAGPDGTPADRRVDIVRGDAVSVTLPEPVRVVAPASRKVSVTDISTVAEGETLVLDKIYFYAGRHVVKKESYESLEALYNTLAAHPKIRVRIEGHVCCIYKNQKDALDDDTGGEELSVNRAKAIRAYLIEHGIAASRLEYAGFGRRRPVVENETTEEEADKNRRVELRVIK